MPLVDVDDRGRLVIPQDLREQFHITPGGKAIVERGPNGVVVRGARPMREVLAELKAEIAKLPKGRKGPDPMRLKDIWTEGLPERYR